MTIRFVGVNIIIGEHNRKESMEEGKKRGPHYQSGIPKDIRLTVRLDKEEHQDLKEKAQKKNMSIAEYIRYLVKNDK